VKRLQEAARRSPWSATASTTRALAQADLGIAMGGGHGRRMEDRRHRHHEERSERRGDGHRAVAGDHGQDPQNMFFALFYNVIGIPIAAAYSPRSA